MNRLPETVTQQFNQLFAVIGRAGDDLKLAIADASMAGNFAQVTANVENCQRLQALELEIKASLNHFENGQTFPPASPKLPSIHRKNHSRGPRGLIRVKLNGKVIEERTIAGTFLETLKALGLDRVAKLNKIVTSVPLMSRQPANGYQRQERVNGWYITTHINKQTAPSVLQEIAKELNVPMQIEFIDS